MNVVSINVGLPRTVSWKGRSIRTGIFKEPVAGPLTLRKLNFDGDGQADLQVHGGLTKAVYIYPAEHYAWWQNELPDMDLPLGIFGENLTTQGLAETTTCIGDRLRIGDVEAQVTEPRMPCYKLGIRFGRDDIVKRFHVARRNGFYCSVAKEGVVEAGDTIEIVQRDAGRVSVDDIVRIFAFERDDEKTLRRALEIEALPESWKRKFREQIAKVEADRRQMRLL